MAEYILVRGVNWVGDTVMTIPALRALKNAYPQSKIVLLVKPSVAPVFEKNPDIDEIIFYEKEHKGFFGKIRLVYKLRRIGFSKAVLLQNAFDAALTAFLAGIPERIGYNRDGRGSLLTKAVPFNNEDRKIHHIDYFLNLVSALSSQSSAFSPHETRPWIFLSPDERMAARQRLSALKRPVLGINPGAAYGPAKRWVPERFVEIANWFMRDTGGSVVVFGGKSEEGIAEQICRHAERGRTEAIGDRHWAKGNEHYSELITHNSELLNLAGKTTLRELISLISECDIFLSNDSGPMHIAYAVGTPLVAIFGSTDPWLTGPAGEGSIVLNSGLSCSPCFERICKENDLRCMYAITTDDVYHALKGLLPVKPAVFFDRDGTLCRDAHYLSDWKDFEIFPETESVKALKERGFSLIGVTNQSGIKKGIVDEGFVRDLNRVFIDRYGFDDFYYCAHGPEDHCSCRKPEPGMLLRARTGHKIDMRRSYVVGDKEADMLLARAVGAKAILVLTGQHKESIYADFIVKDLKEAVDLILKETKG